jgi:uncharacterized integral membrane protein
VTTPDRPVSPGPSPTGPLPTNLPPAGLPASGTPAPAGGPPSTRPAQPPGRRRTRGIGLTLAAALLVFVTVIFVLFVIFNTQTVLISLVFGNVEAPLVLALLIAAGLGVLLVLLASLVRRARRSNR